jgi:acyl carrier protein
VKTHIHSDIRDFVVTTCLSGDERGFDDATDLYQTGILDSFATIALVSFLDETFHVTLDPTDMTPQRLHCVASIAQLVMEKLERERGTSTT